MSGYDINRALLVQDGYGEKPRWFPIYVKLSKGVRIYCVKRQLRPDNLKELSELQKLLPSQIIKTFWQVQDDER